MMKVKIYLLDLVALENSTVEVHSTLTQTGRATKCSKLSLIAPIILILSDRALLNVSRAVKDPTQGALR